MVQESSRLAYVVADNTETPAEDAPVKTQFMTVREFVATKPEVGTIVNLHWSDSEQPTAEWQWLDEIKHREAISVETTGYLVYLTDRTIAVCLSLADMDTPRGQVSGLKRIPTICVHRLQVLSRG